MNSSEFISGWVINGSKGDDTYFGSNSEISDLVTISLGSRTSRPQRAKEGTAWRDMLSKAKTGDGPRQHSSPAADPVDTNQDAGVDVVGGQAVLISEGGARVEQGNEAENAEAETAAAAAAKSKKKRKAARTSFADALEAKFLSRFACTTAYRRIIWDEYFQNATKGM
ncbi:hypothetical protein B0H13DRAFT_1881958 [Mycena leptocephala]|nr:hypothetical protein B0H13DRAFT_1881958 [Mycena leptocephala]